MDNYTKPLDDAYVVSKLITNLINYQTDVVERNQYIDKRDRYLYGDGLFETVLIPDGFDQTLYNYLRPITQIHATQFMQDPFSIYANYRSQTAEGADPNNEQEVQTQEVQKLENTESQVKAWGKKDAWDAIVRDNGGHELWVEGAQTGSDYGSTLYQTWWDDDAKKVRIQLLESIQNWFPIWSDTNFRERIGDAYVTQIAPVIANGQYQSKIPQGGFPVSYAGEPLTTIQGATSTLTASAGETVSSASTRRPMVTVFNFTGKLPGLCERDGEYFDCAPGDETKVSFKAVGNAIVEKISNVEHMPKFYYIPNSIVPRRPYGESDIPEAALQINATIIQAKSDQLTRANKVLYPIIQAIGFEDGTVPPRNQREMTIVPMEPGQEFKPVMFDSQGIEIDRIIADLLTDLLKVTRLPRVLFDDPTVSLNSNQALLTSLRPMTDVVTRKQRLWEPILTQMANDCLKMAALHDDTIAQLLEDDTSYLYIAWPSILRKDDPAHQALLINDLHAGAISIRTYMERRGIQDVSEEINRVAAGMDNPTEAAMQSGMLGTIAHFTIQKANGIPPWGYIVPKVSLRGDLSPEQEYNMADNYQWNSGPAGGAMGPQGNDGTRANDNFINAPVMAGSQSTLVNTQAQPIPGQPQGGQPAAQMTPGQNQPGSQPMSMPGSGAPAVTPQGAMAQGMQRRGRR